MGDGYIRKIWQPTPNKELTDIYKGEDSKFYTES